MFSVSIANSQCRPNTNIVALRRMTTSSLPVIGTIARSRCAITMSARSTRKRSARHQGFSTGDSITNTVVATNLLLSLTCFRVALLWRSRWLLEVYPIMSCSHGDALCRGMCFDDLWLPSPTHTLEMKVGTIYRLLGHSRKSP